MDAERAREKAAGTEKTPRRPGVPVKIRDDTHRKLRMIAAWKNVTIIDYIAELVEREVDPEMENMAEEIRRNKQVIRPIPNGAAQGPAGQD